MTPKNYIEQYQELEDEYRKLCSIRNTIHNGASLYLSLDDEHKF